jgi:hypothetical protein
MKSYHDSFDCKINCEEFSSVSEQEYREVMQMLAEESEGQQGYGDWSDEDQQLWEAEQARLKCWTRNYSPDDEGETYEGIAI